MTVTDLIGKLKQFSPETRIVVAGYEGGYNDIDRIDEVSIKVDADTQWYYGRHKESEKDKGTVAIALTGHNQIAKD
ncbi:MAG: hypothetical protein FVQ77_15275 [Cytophagales bacterium]|nr:hypothetical protein [Cytophagales bacterium]